MQENKDEIKMEENKEGATPTPSQENSKPNDNSDLTPEEFEKELNEMLSQDENAPKNDEQEQSPTPNDEQPSQNDEEIAPVESQPNGELDENQPPMDEPEKETPEKMLSQSQVNDLVGKARKEGRESALKELMSRYGVYNESELDDIFGRGQAYDDLDYDYQNQGKSYKDAMAENALLKSHIDESRWEDVKLILGGKGLEVNAENISALLPSHPEWNGLNNLGNNPIAPEQRILTKDMAEQMVDNQYQNASNQLGVKKPGILKKLGNEPEPAKQKTEEEIAAEMYGYGNW